MFVKNIITIFFFRKSGPFYFDLVRDVLYTLIVTTLALLLYSCKKMVTVDQPINSITTEGAFSTDATATSAVIGIYSKLINNGLTTANGATTVYTGFASDELTKAGISGTLPQFILNNLLSDNTVLSNQLWSPAYFVIYDANSCIEGLEKSRTLTPALQNQLIGECKFLRAFVYFYLTNLWGDIPMPLISDWSKTDLLERTSKNVVYDQIISDLKDAQNLLGSDYSFASNERIRVNKFAATAMLARVYLYKKRLDKC